MSEEMHPDQDGSDAGFEAVTKQLQELLTQIQKVVVGQDKVIQQLIICFVAGGHVLIEGVPGLGKTLLVRALARCFAGSTNRIQFTPDLMPSDVTGHVLFNMKEERFVVRQGPVFTNLLLADEINRAPAKTQAALLEVMQERRVTIENDSFDVPSPFMVLATQNPIEQDGTYPLPEAELDRFMMKTLIDYPDKGAEIQLLDLVTQNKGVDALNVDVIEPFLDELAVAKLKDTASHVTVDPAVQDYIVRIVRQTRDFPGVFQGAGPRAGIALIAISRVAALFENRNFVIPDDVKTLAPAVLRHRVSLTPDLEIEGGVTENVLQDLLEAVEAPRT